MTHLHRGTRRHRSWNEDGGGGYRGRGHLCRRGRGRRSRGRNGGLSPTCTRVDFVLRSGEEADEDGAQKQEEEGSHQQELGQRREWFLHDGNEAVEDCRLFVLGRGSVVWMGDILEKRGRLWIHELDIRRQEGHSDRGRTDGGRTYLRLWTVLGLACPPCGRGEGGRASAGTGRGRVWPPVLVTPKRAPGRCSKAARGGISQWWRRSHSALHADDRLSWDFSRSPRCALPVSLVFSAVSAPLNPRSPSTRTLRCILPQRALQHHPSRYQHRSLSRARWAHLLYSFMYIPYVASVFAAQQCYVLRNAIVYDSEGASGSRIKCQE